MGSDGAVGRYRLAVFEPRQRRLLLAICGGVALVLGIVGAAIRPRWRGHVPHVGTHPTESTPSPHALRGDPGQFPILGWILLGLVSAAMLVVFWRGLRRVIAQLRVRQAVAPRNGHSVGDGAVPGVGRADPDLSRMRAGVAAAQARVVDDVVPREAIVAGWLELERAAAASGMSRSLAQTPTEFTTEVLTRTGANPHAVRGLLQLYLRARFSGVTVTGDEAGRARECVRAIAVSWDDPAAGSDRDVTGGPNWTDRSAY